MYHFLPRELPRPLEALTELALNLRWTWSHAGDYLWRRLDPDLWQRTQNPWVIMQSVPQARLNLLAIDPTFLDELNRAASEHRGYLAASGWYARAHPEDGIGAIAYFSMEFGLSEAFPLYAGGLGILAGDYLKTASDLGLPVTGVGLLYQEGYFRQVIDGEGRQQESYPNNDPTTLPIQPVLDSDGAWLKVLLKLPGRDLHLRVWQANVGRVRLYLLDSNDPLNGPEDRGITAKLYAGGQELRLMQEIVLGVGGWMMLSRLGIEVDICHLNEGHSALAVVERARRFMKKNGIPFHDAWWATRAGNIFTTHTPLAAAFDTYPPELVQKYSQEYLAEFGIPARDLLGLGRRDPDDGTEPFNMAYLALRGCARTNAVSALHCEVSRDLFRDLFPHWPADEVPVTHVTNGVHMPSWDSAAADTLWTDVCGKQRWQGPMHQISDAIAGVPDEALWRLAGDTRKSLIAYARERLAWQFGARGEEAEHIAEAARMLDPNVLTIGFARRFARYKRPNLLLGDDPRRLERLLLDAQRPIQLIIAGKAHPEDDEGKRLVQEWMHFVKRPSVRGRIVYLADYDMALAQQLVQGVDLWLNTPVRTLEACGTSGMKVLVNGGLNLSVLDGWWAEAYQPEVGWAIDGAARGDAAHSDAVDAEELYRLIEDEIVPMFYDRDVRGVPVAWVQRIRASMASLTPVFSSNRMLDQYLTGFYQPAAADFRGRSADHVRLAHELNEWASRLAAGWRELHFGSLRIERSGGEWLFSVPVYLGAVAPDAIAVELCADAVPGFPKVRCLMSRESPITGAENGYVYTGRVSAARPDWHYTPRIRPHHAAARVPAECPLALWQH